jgi:exonuclease VII large subunit
VLSRGYAIATTAAGRAVRDTSELSVGQRLTVRVERGRFDAEVVSVPAQGGQGEKP